MKLSGSLSVIKSKKPRAFKNEIDKAQKILQATKNELNLAHNLNSNAKI